MVLYLMIVVAATVTTAVLAAYGTCAEIRRPTGRDRRPVAVRTDLAGRYAARVRTCRSPGDLSVGGRSWSSRNEAVRRR
ncbi:hypothetical protein [Nocardia africana]|uniref:Uncharacterized protein n=1 Tax=Nocardia africana TaxID=134964 RepID=A0A378WZ41_9NOCA|nr:hypothetical protein [Nocardia africana]MCC3313069.1 hypothetical protein [Nocardia africana]SUA45583.1 Uncharacterised protein [Nocardia africana]